MSIHTRLAAVAAAVRRGCRVADIGTDHAYLPVYLVREGIAAAVIATDLRPGPLAAGRRTVEAAGLGGRITLREGDGLAPVLPDEVDDIVIAGMGGETIAAILAAAPWIRAPHYRLVLQPMTRIPALHAALLTSGFTITREWMVEDEGRQYVLLTAAFTGNKPVFDRFAHLVGGFAPGEGIPYRQKTARHLRKQAAGLQDTDPTEAAALRCLADRLGGNIHDGYTGCTGIFGKDRSGVDR